MSARYKLRVQRAPRAHRAKEAPAPPPDVSESEVRCPGVCRARLKTVLDVQLHRCDPIATARRTNDDELGLDGGRGSLELP